MHVSPIHPASLRRDLEAIVIAVAFVTAPVGAFTLIVFRFRQ